MSAETLRFGVVNLIHVAIKTNDLEAMVRFYKNVLDFIEYERPAFGYPGAWLGSRTTGPIIHLYGGSQGLAADGSILYGTGAIDHVSLMFIGFHELVLRLEKYAIQWREYIVPGTNLYQVFFYDPSGVLLELTLDREQEQICERVIITERLYVAGEGFNV